jgi:hypothetical protein
MPEWASCPQCQLKHQKRPDGHCPRCKAPLDDAGAAPTEDTYQPVTPVAGAAMPSVYDGRTVPGSSYAAAAQASQGDASMSTGGRVAGGILILNGLAVAAEKAMMPGESGIFSSPVSMLIDIGFGIMLIAGKTEALPLAKFRAVAGGLVFPIVHLYQGNTLVALLQVIFSTSLVLLLFGRPAGLRLASGVTGAALCLGVELLGLRAIATGSNPLARWMMAGQIESAPAGVVEGRKFSYRFTAAGTEWHLRTEAAAAKDNPLADRWIVRPSSDAHVLVIAEELPVGTVVDMDRFVEVVLTNARAGSKNLQVVEQGPLSPYLSSRLLHTRSTVSGMDMEWLIGLYAQDRYIFQVMAFARQGQFDALSAEMRQIILSFETP